MMGEIAQGGRGNQGRIFGFPLEGFSLFQSLLLTVAAAFLTFFGTTCISIFGLLAWNVLGGHSINYADTYRFIGLPAGLIVLVLALPFFLVLWVRAKVHR